MEEATVIEFERLPPPLPSLSPPTPTPLQQQVEIGRGKQAADGGVSVMCAGDAAVLLGERTDQQDEAVEHKVPPTPKSPPPSPPPRAKEKVVLVDRQWLSSEQIVFVVMMNEFDKADVQEQCQKYPHRQQQPDEKLQ